VGGGVFCRGKVTGGFFLKTTRGQPSNPEKNPPMWCQAHPPPALEQMFNKPSAPRGIKENKHILGKGGGGRKKKVSRFPLKQDPVVVGWG